MPECAYSECDIVFDENPTGRKRIYCGPQCQSLAQRPHVIEHVKHCKYCGKSFTTRRSKKICCCSKCQKLGKRQSIAASQTPEQTAAKQRRNDERLEARVRAALNCALHPACLRAEKLPCLNCTKKIYKEDAWKHEPGVLVHNE